MWLLWENADVNVDGGDNYPCIVKLAVKVSVGTKKKISVIFLLSLLKVPRNNDSPVAISTPNTQILGYNIISC